MASKDELSQNEKIVLVMGPTGAGKSTFIDFATGQDSVTSGTIGHGLDPYTEAVQRVNTIHPDSKYPVVFIDTPGLDNIYKSDTEILSMIIEWLVKTYKYNFDITGILYLHRITDNRKAESVAKTLRLFGEMWSTNATANVIIVTTMWGEIKESTGKRREARLKREFWNTLMADGCRVERFGDTTHSAWQIIGAFEEPRKPPGTYHTSTDNSFAVASNNRFSQRDRIVVLLGPPGAGKSTFIDYAINGNGEGINHTMQNSRTRREFEAFTYPHPTDGHPVLFVDTPGFDEEVKSATTVLSELAKWLKKKYKGHVDVAAIIYLHKIDANRMTGSLMKSLQSFKDFQAAMPRIVIATTMWSEVKKQTAERREKELKDGFWQDLVDRNGCRIARFGDTHQSAWDIVGDLALKPQVSSNKRWKFTKRIRSIVSNMH